MLALSARLPGAAPAGASHLATQDWIDSQLHAYARAGVHEERLVSRLQEWRRDVDSPLNLEDQSIQAFEALPEAVMTHLHAVVASMVMPCALESVPQCIASFTHLQGLAFPSFAGRCIDLSHCRNAHALSTLRVNDAPALEQIRVLGPMDVIGSGSLPLQKIEVLHLDAAGATRGTSSVLGQCYYAARREGERPGIDRSRLNGKAGLKDTQGRILCRHLVMDAVLMHAAHDREKKQACAKLGDAVHLSDYRAELIGTVEKLSDRIAVITERRIWEALHLSRECALVHHGAWGMCLRDAFRSMQLGAKVLVIVWSAVHCMLLSLQVKARPHGRFKDVEYVLEFYDPNATLTHLRQVLDLDAVARLTLHDFVRDSKVRANYYPLDSRPGAQAVESTDMDLAAQLSCFTWVPTDWAVQERMDLPIDRPTQRRLMHEYFGPRGAGTQCPSRVSYLSWVDHGLEHLPRLMSTCTPSEALRQTAVVSDALWAAIHHGSERNIELLMQTLRHAVDSGRIGQGDLVAALVPTEEGPLVWGALGTGGRGLECFLREVTALRCDGHLTSDDAMRIVGGRAKARSVLSQAMSANDGEFVQAYVEALKKVRAQGGLDSDELATLLRGTEASSRSAALRAGFAADALGAVDAWCAGVAEAAQAGLLNRSQVQIAYALRFVNGRISPRWQSWSSQVVHLCESGWARAMQACDAAMRAPASAVARVTARAVAQDMPPVEEPQVERVVTVGPVQPTQARPAPRIHLPSARREADRSEAARALLPSGGGAFVDAVRLAMQDGDTDLLENATLLLRNAALSVNDSRRLRGALKSLLRRRVLFWHIATPLAREVRRTHPACLRACEQLIDGLRASAIRRAN